MTWGTLITFQKNLLKAEYLAVLPAISLYRPPVGALCSQVFFLFVIIRELEFY